MGKTLKYFVDENQLRWLQGEDECKEECYCINDILTTETALFTYSQSGYEIGNFMECARLHIDIRNHIDKVVFNGPATIIIWKDGNKTVVKAQDDEAFDPEKGFAMAVTKYVFGNEGNYYNTVNKYVEPI